jgi:hypothetical protein
VITIIKDSLSKDLIMDCVQQSQEQFRGKNLRTNYGWGFDLVQESSPVLINDIPEDSDVFKGIMEYLKTRPEVPTPKEIRMMFFYWTKGSYIPWHTDQNYEAGITIYLNDVWGRDDGGLFLYREDEQIKGLIPEFNMMVIQTGGIDHCVTPVIRVGSIRASIQIFLK